MRDDTRAWEEKKIWPIKQNMSTDGEPLPALLITLQSNPDDRTPPPHAEISWGALHSLLSKIFNQIQDHYLRTVLLIREVLRDF